MSIHLVTDDDALQQILAAERPRLLRLCASLSGQPDAAEDLVQETLVEAWRHFDQLRDPQALSAWLSGIARNVCARWLRARGREQALAALPVEAVWDDPQVAAEVDFEAELERDELGLLLDRALALLPPTTRAVLVRKYIAESSHAAIAGELGLTESAVAVRLHRGRLALRSLLSTDLRAEAEQLGLLPAGDGLRETRIWCPVCGAQRLQGQIDHDGLLLRCPRCCTEPGAALAQASRLACLEAVTRFRPAYKRFSGWMHGYFQDAIASGGASCCRCGKPTQLRMGLPAYAPPSVRQRGGIHVLCAACGSGAYESLDGLAFNTPAVQRFWGAHERIRLRPQRELEHEGLPALAVGFESVISREQIEVVLHRDSFAILAIRGQGHE
jgi:RNA polymerase sigma-70 factor (ECF subfamily)